MKVHFPSPLHSYTGGRSEIELEAGSAKELMARLEQRFPGLPFRIVDEQGRIRPHIQIFRNGKLIRSLEVSLSSKDEVTIVAALSGG